MNKLEEDILKEAIKWWMNNRPVDWTEQKHLNNPCVAIKLDSDYCLANAVARYVNVYGGTKTDYEKSVEEFSSRSEK